MKTQILTQRRKLQPKQQELLNFMLQHADADGQLDPKKMDREVPGWDAPYPSRKWVISTSARLRNKGRLATERHFANGGAPPAADAAGEMKGLTARQQAALTVHHNYRDGNRIQWDRVAAEHPEWVEMLGGNGKPKWQLFSNTLHRLKLAEKLRPHLPATMTPELEAQITKRVLKGIEQGLHGIMAELRNCPRCGKSLEAVLADAAKEVLRA